MQASLEQRQPFEPLIDENRPARYSHDYPVGQGHDYALNDVRWGIWDRAKARAHAEERSVRTILIRGLDLYGNGKLDL